MAVAARPVGQDPRTISRGFQTAPRRTDRRAAPCCHPGAPCTPSAAWWSCSLPGSGPPDFHLGCQ
eukprot:scaffold7724_cov248-Pinguiococcus_pyrenoidosus.AAC.2